MSGMLGRVLARITAAVIVLTALCSFLQAQSGAYVSITSYGAKGDAVIHSDGAANGTATFTSASSSFSSADVGKFIEITGAGASSGILSTTIKSVQSATSITLTTSASSSGTGLYFTYGTDNTSAFQSAYNAAVPLSVPAGSYIISASPSSITGSTPLIITGSGPDSKLLSDTNIFNLSGATSGTSITNLDLEPIAKFTVVPLNPKATTPPSKANSSATCTVSAQGTPILIDIFGTGNGIEPTINVGDTYATCWASLSPFQRAEVIGPTIVIKSGDHVTVSNITGNQVGIELRDVTNSVLQNNDFTGSSYAGHGCLGIISSTNGTTPTNIGDSLTGNKVRYCSYSNIYWANSSDLAVSGNISEYAGESGFKNFSPWAKYASNFVSVANNVAIFAFNDGFDLSADYPHSATYTTNSTATGNVSLDNQGTGYYSDGLNWNFTANSATSNGLEGFYLDYSNSTISGNTSLNNNMDSLTSSNQNNQIVIGGCCATSSNIIENNFINITISGITGDAMWVGSSNTTADNNVVQELAGEGGLWFNVAPVNSSGNTGLANTFAGNVTINGSLQVNGSLSKTTGSFKIDHPLDPLNKYLIHSFVESPDMMNVYNGIVELDEKGQAEVSLPSYFEALNYNFRYQLTSLGRFERVYIAREVKDNEFLIAGGHPHTRVSWQVTGIRKDPYAEAHRIQPEVDKSDNERGHYLHPEVYAEGKK